MCHSSAIHKSRLCIVLHAFAGKITNQGTKDGTKQNDCPASLRRKVYNGSAKDRKQNGPNNTAFYALAGRNGSGFLKVVTRPVAALWHSESFA
jgi:hypothetical protein